MTHILLCVAGGKQRIKAAAIVPICRSLHWETALSVSKQNLIQTPDRVLDRNDRALVPAGSDYSLHYPAKANRELSSVPLLLEKNGRLCASTFPYHPFSWIAIWIPWKREDALKEFSRFSADWAVSTASVANRCPTENDFVKTSRISIYSSRLWGQTLHQSSNYK